MSNPRFYTVLQLARRLGVRQSSVRHWITRGLLERPPRRFPDGSYGFPIGDVDRIETWYLRRCISGRTRGPKARERREAAQARLFRPLTPRHLSR